MTLVVKVDPTVWMPVTGAMQDERKNPRTRNPAVGKLAAGLPALLLHGG